jgi:hypothetical protein
VPTPELIIPVTAYCILHPLHFPLGISDPHVHAFSTELLPIVNPFARGRSVSELIPRCLPHGPGGLVSKHRERPYHGRARSKRWVKVKNRTHKAMERVMDALA